MDYQASLGVVKKMFLLLSVVAIGQSCSTSHSVNRQNAQSRVHNGIDNPSHSETLVDHLIKVPGINVVGDGRNAKITIHGVSTLYGSNEPLYVVNGQQLNGGLQEAMNIIPVSDIKSIRVLKNPSEVGGYGVRGANGVIVITLK
jgi:TonB-dependent SusC/RagA subfamily outer membrane receptor